MAVRSSGRKSSQPGRPWAPNPTDRRAVQRDRDAPRRPADWRIFADPGWLPDGQPLDGLELPAVIGELHDRHIELLAARGEASRRVSELHQAYRLEDDQHGDWYEAGSEGEPPSMTDQAVRNANLKAASEMLAGAEADLLEFARGAIDSVREQGAQLAAIIEGQENRLEDRRRALQDELNSVGQQLLQTKRLEGWARRMDRAIPGTLLSWRHLFETPMSPDGSTAGHSREGQPLPGPATDQEEAHPDVTATPNGARRFTRETGYPNVMTGET